MGYAILRTQKLKSGQAVRRSLTHAFREQDTPNADPDRLGDNSHFGAKCAKEALGKLNARLPDKVRKNAVLAIEYLITASPEDITAKSREQQDAYFFDAIRWLQTKHGKENVLYAGIHRDETTPHMYAYVVPIDERGKLNCRAFLGGAKALSDMQTDFANAVGQFHGLQRGREGSKAKHKTIREYYSKINEAFDPLPEVKTPMPARLRDEPVKPGMFASSDVKSAYERDFSKWQKEKAEYEAQRQKHLAELKTQRELAVATAIRHQAQAAEARSLKLELDEIKEVNSYFSKKYDEMIEKQEKLQRTLDLFRPSELKAAIEREKNRIAAENARLSEIAMQKALEAARERKQAAPQQSKAEPESDAPGCSPGF